MNSTVVYTDLDGCLLNSDYTYSEAIPALLRLKSSGIPLVLVSSKTEAEMVPLAEELELDSPLVCENGGIISWRGFQAVGGAERTIVGVERSRILAVLDELRSRFKFRSFQTLGLQGIIDATGLAVEQADRAASRMTTEPLVWDDLPERIRQFEQLLVESNLTLTRGGRFWHVSGPVNKGDGMQAVHQSLSEAKGTTLTSVAIGDSPIDLPMLERADTAVVIPGEDGVPRIHPANMNCIFADRAGAAGWNTALLEILDSLS